MEEVDEDHLQDMQQSSAAESVQSKDDGDDTGRREEEDAKDGFCTSQLITAEAATTSVQPEEEEESVKDADGSEVSCDDKEKTPVAQIEDDTKEEHKQGQQHPGLTVTASTDDLSSSMSSGHTIAAANPTESSAASSTNALGSLEKEEKDDDDGVGSQGSSSGSGGNGVISRQLDEAMVEQEKRSETSSSKSYEVVAKSPTSGATSGDELETNTTSSDIEIISNPSATAPSPVSGVVTAKRPATTGRNGGHAANNNSSSAGHARTSSEISAAWSDDHSTHPEMDRLQRRVAELTELLEARETKLVEMSRSSHELQEQNSDLASRVKEAMRVHARLAEAAQSSEEATGRMADMEKKLQKALAENERLKAENKVFIERK